MYFLKKFLCN